jgi:hypothetical protein
LHSFGNGSFGQLVETFLLQSHHHWIEHLGWRCTSQPAPSMPLVPPAHVTWVTCNLSSPSPMNRWACFPTKIGSPPKVWHKRRSHPPIYEYHPTIRAFRKQINQASEALAATLAGPLDAFQIRALLARSAFASIRVSNKWLLAKNAIRQETSSTFCEHWRILADSESVLFGLCMMKLWQPLPAQVHPALKLKASSPCHVVTAITCSKMLLWHSPGVPKKDRTSCLSVSKPWLFWWQILGSLRGTFARKHHCSITASINMCNFC